MQPSLASNIRKAVAAIEVLGGTVGIAMALSVAPGLARAAHMSLWVSLLVMLPAFVLSLVAGLLLWRGGTFGQVLALLVLALQVPVISNPSFGYFFNSGLAFRIMLGPGGWSWYAFLGSQIHVSWAEGASGTTVGVNVVGLVLGALLFAAIPTNEPARANQNGARDREDSIARPSA